MLQFLLALKNNDIKKCGNVLKENWNLKKKLDDNVYLKKFSFIEKKLKKIGKKFNNTLSNKLINLAK
mgnify:CR=1 FL=1